MRAPASEIALRDALAAVWGDLMGRGVYPALHRDLNPIAAVNAALADDPAAKWYQLMPMYDPAREPGADAFCVLMHAEDRLAACVAVRLRHFAGSLADCLADGSFFTAAPLWGASVRPVRAPDGKDVLDGRLSSMRGPVAIIGAGYIHPSHRDAGILRPMFTAAALLSAILWPRAQHAICVTRARDLQRMGHQVLGFPRTHGLIEVHDPRWPGTAGAHEIALMSMTRAEVVDDAARLAMRGNTKKEATHG